ncbi:MAG: DUF2130 domain-containing protein [Deltaproteobacteria bacterium]|nr:DUF2130 domain-containing protein [Deltaproteobacteria bacterium]
MEQGKITCPNCGEEFEISDALTGRIREHLKGELLKEVSRREAKLKEKTEALKVQEAEISKSREAIDDEIETQLKKRLADAEKKAAQKLEGQYADQLKDLQGAIEEKDDALKGFREQELELRKEQRKLKEAAESLELEVARKLDEEREKIRGEAEKKLIEEHRLKDLEKDKKINDLRSSLEDMKRKAEQGSMETQGEVLEQDFEAQLKSFFVHDDIQPVPKGVRGADLIQTVRTTLGAESGKLLWETKNTKAWSTAWIPKLKDDMIEVRASVAILVSVVLPDGINRFGPVDGVWVSDPLSAIPLAAALREQLMAVSRERTATIGKSAKMETLYQYLAGVEFKQKIEGIVEAFTSMQDQLNKERRTMERHWKQREKEIERVVKNTVGLYGDMQGIIGGQIPSIPALELDEETTKQLSKNS